jgi:hypothetical protein
LVTGKLHTYGGSDFYAWRPGGGPSCAVASIGSRIPPFTYGRPKADNWVIDRAIEMGRVQVVDVSAAVVAVHLAHSYSLVRGLESLRSANITEAVMAPEQWDVNSDENIWSKLKGGDEGVMLNKYLAYTQGSYINQEGTPLHAPWALMLCEKPARPAQAGGEGLDAATWGGLNDRGYLCLRRRMRPAACGCEHTAYFMQTQTDPKEMKGGQLVCGTRVKNAAPNLTEAQAFPLLVRQRAGADKTVVLLGFNYGYCARPSQMF